MNPFDIVDNAIAAYNHAYSEYVKFITPGTLTALNAVVDGLRSVGLGWVIGAGVGGAENLHCYDTSIHAFTCIQ